MVLSCPNRWAWRLIWIGFGVCIFLALNFVDFLNLISSRLHSLEDSVWEKVFNPWVIATYILIGVMVDILVGKCAKR